MIRIENLTKTFGRNTVVDNLSFNVERGEVLGFLGPNGAGKSTTMRMITGFLPPTFGRVSVGGHYVVSEPLAAKRLMGYLPESAASYGDMTVNGFLTFVAELRGIAGDARKRAVNRVVDLCFLESVLYQSIDTLSKGYRHRTCLAQALIHDPEVLIMDEPTDGLDPNQKHEVRALINAMAKDKTIVVSTHILEEVHAVCNRAIIISGGRLVADGSPAELEARSPTHRAIHLHLAEAYAGARDAIAALAGVREVRADESGRRLVVLPAAGDNPLPALARLVHDKGWVADDLHVERGRLDEVFRTITREAA